MTKDSNYSPSSLRFFKYLVLNKYIFIPFGTLNSKEFSILSYVDLIIDLISVIFKEFISSIKNSYILFILLNMSSYSFFLLSFISYNFNNLLFQIFLNSFFMYFIAFFSLLSIHNNISE